MYFFFLFLSCVWVSVCVYKTYMSHVDPPSLVDIDHGSANPHIWSLVDDLFQQEIRDLNETDQLDSKEAELSTLPKENPIHSFYKWCKSMDSPRHY